jgi:hypothetical protein
MSENEERLDKALSDRLAGRADGGDTLSPYRASLEALEALWSTPARDPLAAAQNRQAFLHRARTLGPAVSRTSHQRRTGWIILPGKERSPMTALVSLALALALAFGGAGATAYAAQDSLPSDPLYNVKLIGEQVQLTLTRDPQGDFDLLVSFAAERIREMTALAAAGEGIPAQVQTRLQEQLQLALHYAAQLGDTEMAGALAQIRTMAENQARALEQARQNAPEQADEALRLAEQLMTRARNTAEGGLEDPLAFRLRQGSNRPEGAPAQPDSLPGGGEGSGDGPCDDCSPEATGPGPHGSGQGGTGPGRHP